MARKKREIQKRKKQQESRLGPVEETETRGTVPVRMEETGSGEVHPRKHSQVAAYRTSPYEASRRAAKTAAVSRDTWLGRNKENLLLGLLVLYVFLLGLGTVGELFEIEWILNLPLFR
jgi:hypothetical protein